MTQDASQSKDWYTIAGNYAPLAIVAILALGGTGAAATGNLKMPGSMARINGPDDPIAIAIGHAEGTRTCDGGKTKAYGGHADPGDGKANRGTFSAAPNRGNGTTAQMTPEEADANYIGNLNRHIDGLEKLGIKLSPSELATFADLTVQAHPDVGVQYAKGGGETIDRRVNAYKFDGKLHAAGFGNSEGRLRADQIRRQARLDKCLQK